jgi:hypothetical protein
VQVLWETRLGTSFRFFRSHSASTASSTSP